MGAVEERGQVECDGGGAAGRAGQDASLLAQGVDGTGARADTVRAPRAPAVSWKPTNSGPSCRSVSTHTASMGANRAMPMLPAMEFRVSSHSTGVRRRVVHPWAASLQNRDQRVRTTAAAGVSSSRVSSVTGAGFMRTFNATSAAAARKAAAIPNTGPAPRAATSRPAAAGTIRPRAASADSSLAASRLTVSGATTRGTRVAWVVSARTVSTPSRAMTAARWAKVSASKAQASTRVPSRAALARSVATSRRGLRCRSTRMPIGTPRSRKPSPERVISTPIWAAPTPRARTASTSMATSVAERPPASSALEATSQRARPSLFAGAAFSGAVVSSVRGELTTGVSPRGEVDHVRRVSLGVSVAGGRSKQPGAVRGGKDV